MIASVCTSSAVRVWTADFFDLNADGNALGFDVVVIDLDDVSEK